MAIVSSRELPRENKFRFGESRDLTRRFVITHDGTPPTGNELVAGLNIDLGSIHPEYGNTYCIEVDYREGYEDSQYHGEFVARYSTTDPDNLVQPVSRPPKWTFSTQGVTIPAFRYFSGQGNATLLPLTNSAFDYFEGVTGDEAQCKVTIQQNLATFPNALAIALTNCINSSPWIGGATHCWKCQGISAELKFEMWNNTLYRFWDTSAEILFRQTGWPLQLPDVGFNFILNNQKRRAVVFDFENAEWVASPGPVGLDGNGGLTLGAPAILTRRVHPEVNFNSYFGSPPA